MARFVFLLVSLVVAVLASESSTKASQSEEILNNLNTTNEKLDQLIKQVLETRKLVEEQNEKLIKFSNETNDRLAQLDSIVNQHHNQAEEKRKNDEEKLNALANITERHIQFFQSRFPTHCNVARSAILKTLSNGKKYFFHPTQANWNSANETCSNQGLQLATFRDQNDAQVVAAETSRIYDGGCWVSAKNSVIRGEKDFRWRDGTNFELNSPLWKDKPSMLEDCVYTFNWAKGKLNTWSCTKSLHFICELPSECY
ncbi:uncharacterized protein LOC132194042 [Neocloeon triangulifer]|uniref:uncharacterized protein LOC132194042 n=1 Tax=Neocloeon triangulifer TaxID=2078957 RepID=UPI00286F38B8|nr:uncharacterized protein LOC132194042 [Neocloeon triangulifer]